MKQVWIFGMLLLANVAGAQDVGAPPSDDLSGVTVETIEHDGAELGTTVPTRDPAALTIPPRKRLYAGGAHEEDLRVQPALPDAALKTDARSLQREVYKSLFNQDLKEERHDDAEE